MSIVVIVPSDKVSLHDLTQIYSLTQIYIILCKHYLSLCQTKKKYMLRYNYLLTNFNEFHFNQLYSQPFNFC